jgi:hypothetical protein
VTGASGAGVTTLGATLAGALSVPHLDTDDFYWLPSDPPFRHKREIPERLRLLDEALDRAPRGFVLSGSLDGWGYRTFLEWAAVYDEGKQGGRSRPRHEAWLARLPCPAVRLEGVLALDVMVNGSSASSV